MPILRELMMNKQSLRSIDLSFAAIILAAGKGKRMNSKNINKVALPLGGKPMILYTVEILEKLGIKTIIIVVGFAKNSVMDLFPKGKVKFCEQKKRLGTAHAVYCGMKKVPSGTKNILVLQGDDSALYKVGTIKQLIEKHLESDASFTFLTIEMEDPKGLGRVIRGKEGKVLAIVEEKDATEGARKIKEINPACYVFKTDFLKKYLPKIKRSPVTGEYYLTSLIDMGIKNNENLDTLQAGLFAWRGVNTKEELEVAENIFLKIKGKL